MNWWEGTSCYFGTPKTKWVPSLGVPHFERITNGRMWDWTRKASTKWMEVKQVVMFCIWQCSCCNSC